MATRIGIDTGGTFTDVVRLDRRGLTVHKLRSTPTDPSRAVLEGLAGVRRSTDEPVDLVHGTTVGLNAVLTGTLARTVLVTNRGFEDLIEIGRQERTALYALAPTRPVPPVPRRLRVGVACRRGAGGSVIERLTRTELTRVTAEVRRLRPQAIAIGLLHAPSDPADEHALAATLRRSLPSVPVTCSADLHAGFGEYERFSAAILNAAIAPTVGRYTDRVAAGLGAGTLRLLRSSLGILPADEARAYPARAMFSGPAGGVLATAQLRRQFGFDRVAAFDMGGTSADVCLVEAEPEMTQTGTIAGLPLPLPAVPVHTVAAGGGSIAHVDAGGALRVGPASAGADPGPACYGKGEAATVTDAHVALGHLGPTSLLDGAFAIDVDASVRAVERLARQLGMSTRAAAEGIVTVADATMARAILVITAARAVDPAGVPLLAFGGAGGLHAATLAQQLGMPEAIVPAHPGAFSAVGIALAGDAREQSVALQQDLDTTGLADLLERADDLRRTVHEALAGDPATRPQGRITVRLEAMVRYRGQGAPLVLPVDRRLPARFAAAHERRFGFRMDAPVECVQLRARAERPPRALPASQEPEHRARRTRPADYRRPPVGGAAVPIYTRPAVRGPIVGPAICEEPTGTIRIPEGFKMRPTPFGMRLQAIG